MRLGEASCLWSWSGGSRELWSDCAHDVPKHLGWLFAGFASHVFLDSHQLGHLVVPVEKLVWCHVPFGLTGIAGHHENISWCEILETNLELQSKDNGLVRHVRTYHEHAGQRQEIFEVVLRTLAGVDQAVAKRISRAAHRMTELRFSLA